MKDLNERRIAFFIRLAKESHRWARECRRDKYRVSLVPYHEGQRFAYLLCARHLHDSMGGKFRNRMRRAA